MTWSYSLIDNLYYSLSHPVTNACNIGDPFMLKDEVEAHCDELA